MLSASRKGEVAVFFTGGTIGMKQSDDRHGVVPAIDLDRLMEEVRPVVGDVGIRPVQWADLPSPHMTPELMFQLAQDVERMLADDKVIGAVVTHGTDVMEETAYLLDLVVEVKKPIVFTGSMRYFGEPGYDGVRNLRSAILACASPLPSELGVTVLMTDRLYSAREVTKIHSMGIDSFDAPGAGPVGYIVGDDIHIFRNPMRRRFCRTDRVESHVDLITFCPGMGDYFVGCAIEHGAKGLVVEGFGAGNIPPGAAKAVKEAVDKGIPVVLTSRCIEGGVWPIYAYAGGAAELQEKGVILGGNLPSQKARILLMAALGRTDDLAEIRHIFERPTA